MTLSPRARALLATLRIANAPSVASHTMVSFAFGFGLAGDASLPLHHLLAAVVGACMIYFAGNLLNDWYDAAWDRKNRPERSIPAGLFRPSTFLVAAIAFLLLGSLLLSGGASLSLVLCLTLIASITLYTRIHKVTSWGILPMGLCRALLYPLGFLAGCRAADPAAISLHPALLPLGLGLASYIAGLSLSARFESLADPPGGARIASLALLMVPLVTHQFALSLCLPSAPKWIGLAASLPFLTWILFTRCRRLRPTPRYVSALLAGIPWIDALFFTPLSLSLLSTTAHPGLFIAAALTPFAAFLSAIGLQRLAAAT